MWSIAVCFLLFLVEDANMAVTITAYDGTAISGQEPLTITCNYTKEPRDFIVGFNWIQNDALIASGTLSPKNVIFQSGSPWATGVFLGDFVSSLAIQLPTMSVNQSAAGNYTCKLSTLFGSVQDTATAYILEIQTLSGFPSVYKQIEFSNLHIDCSRFINHDTPAPINFTWTRKGEVVSSTPNLSIISVERSEGGNYTCTVNSSTGAVSETVDVVIEYKPHISGQNAVYSILELSPLNIDCSSYTAEGIPSNTSFRWTGPAGFSSAGSLLSVNRIRRNQTGRYTCTASNTLTPTRGSTQTGADTGQFNVIVEYLDSPLLTLDKAEVMENESVTLGCSVSSNPMAVLTIQTGLNDSPLVQQYTNSLQYTIPKVNCLQNGSITCSAVNREIGSERNASTELNVWCSPRLDERNTFTSTLYGEVDEVVSLVVEVIANPAPAFIWFKYNNKKVLHAIPSSIEHTVTSAGQRSTLEVTPKTTDDFGIYAAVVSNKYGRIQVMMTLSPASCPVSHTGDNFWTGVGVGIVIVSPVVIGLIVALVCAIRNHQAPKQDNEKSPPVSRGRDKNIYGEVIDIRL